MPAPRDVASQHLRTFERLPAAYSLFAGTVPAAYSLFAGTLPAFNLFLNKILSQYFPCFDKRELDKKLIFDIFWGKGQIFFLF